MSVKISACLNPVSSERTILEANPGSIKDIITSLNSGFPLSHARVCRNGGIIKDFSIEAKDGDALSVKFVPYGTNEEIGIGMKIGGWVLAAVGIGLSFIPVVGGYFGAALIGTGISMALGGTIMMNVDVPKPEDRGKPEQNPSIRGAKNQARPYGRIPVLFGKHRIYPDLAANQYTEIKGSQQYFIQLFCGGYKDYTIDRDSFKLGDIPLIDFSQTKDMMQILTDRDPAISMEIIQNGSSSGIYPICVHEEVLNAPLQKEIKDADGNLIPGEIICKTPDKTDSINIDIFLQNGIGKYNSEGKLGSASVEVKAWFKGSKDSDYIPLGYFNGNSNIISGAELKMKRYQIARTGLPRDLYTIKIERITKDASDSKIIDAVHVGSVRSKKHERPIRAIRQNDLTIIALKVLATSRLNNVLDSFNYVATSKLPVYSKNGSGPLYWLNTTETRNPASMLLYALRGRASQQIVDPGDIDWPSIEKFYLWCGEHEYACNAYLSESVTIAELIRMIGSTSRADILRIDSKISVVQDIERPSCMQLFTPKNTAGYSVTMFNADIPDAIALGFIDEAAGFAHNELSVYNTPDGSQAGEPDSIQKADLWGITDDKQARRIGMYNYACLKNRPFVHTIEADIEYLVVNKGDWIQYAGDIALTGSVQGRIKGIILADGVCIGIDTDEPVVMNEGQKHAVRIRMSDGTIVLKEVVYNPGLRREKSITYFPVDEGGDLHEPPLGDMYAVDENDNVYYEPQNVIYFTEPVEAKDAPKAGNVYAFGVRGYEVIDLIITDIQPGQNLSATLTCVEYSPAIFDVDKPDFILPEFENKITPVSGAVDHGAVNPDNWKHFTVYHDSEEEPERPSGSGQGDGWHNEQTFRSIWQSSKTAESIESGEWGLPVRIKAQRGTDDVTPIWLGVTPQNVTLETDGDGNILAGLLPLEIQARLFQWNSVLSGVIYSLAGAPEGISIYANGHITVSANAVLGENNSITVNADYQGTVYTSIFTIKKNIRSSPAKYLGTITAMPLNAMVLIITGPVQGQVRALQGDFVLAVEAVGGEQAGSVFQWTGTAWVYRDAVNHADLYTRCFKDGLEVLATDTKWFGAVFAARIAAMEAFIETLETQVLKITGVIYGGDRFNELGEVVNKNAKGWYLGADGALKAFEGEFLGHLEAKTGTFFDACKFHGDLDCGSLQVADDPNSLKRFPASGVYTGSQTRDVVITEMAAAMGITYNEFISRPRTFIVNSGVITIANVSHNIVSILTESNRIVITYIHSVTGRENTFSVSPIFGAASVWFQLGTSGKKVRLVGLPLDPAAARVGTVWKQDAGDGSSFVKVKN